MVIRRPTAPPNIDLRTGLRAPEMERVKLNPARRLIVDALERVRTNLFLREVQEEYKLTFIARHQDNPELDIVVTEDDRDGLAALVERRLP